MEYTIGELSKLLGINSSALRYYEKEGLLPGISRSEGGVRKYDEAHIAMLRLIDCLKKTGMPLKDIKDFINMTQQGDETIDARLALFEKQKAAVEKQIEELHRTLDIINYKYWYYTVAKEKGSTAAVENIPDDEMTPELIETRDYLHRSLL